MVFHSNSDINFRLQDLPRQPLRDQVLLTTPEHFDVQYVINPHMAGNIGDIDRSAAQQQWIQLRDAYQQAGVAVHTLDGAPGLLDMVFCANQTLPYWMPESQQRGVVLSRMASPQRAPEVDHYARFFADKGFDVQVLPDAVAGHFEGMGDALWHDGRALLWGGYGFRTDPAAYSFISETLGVPVIALRLEDPDFYHLDTCLSILDETTALWYPGAFEPEGAAMIRAFFPRLIEAPEDEARSLFACNAHCPDQQHVLIQRGCTVTNQRLQDAGFEVVELDTSEFLKAGGSVFCMKQMFWGD